MQAADARLVTPEAVVLRFDTAGLGSRFLARALDTGVQLAVILALLMVESAARAGGVGSTPLVIFFLVGVFAVVFLYPALFEALWRGRTLGKAALGLRVETREGAPIRFRHAAIRSAMFVVDGILFGPSVGVLTILVSRDNQRLGDMTAGTIVVRERTGARPPTAVAFPMPYGYDHYVASLDVSGLTAAHYEAVRAFLLRAPSLEPRVRYDLARQLGTTIAARMHHAPPAGMSPEVFLGCVAAAFQRRSTPPSAGWAPPSPSWAPPSTPAPAGDGWGAPPPTPPRPAPPAQPAGSDFAPPG